MKNKHTTKSQNKDLDFAELGLYGEEFNENSLAELQKIQR